jgi:hypothetical protein
MADPFLGAVERLSTDDWTFAYNALRAAHPTAVADQAARVTHAFWMAAGRPPDSPSVPAPALTPEQWARLAELWTTHGQGYGTADQAVAAELYKAAGVDPNQVAEEFAQGQIVGEAVNADGTPK